MNDKCTKKRILGIIPARGGSKGIKGKNIIDVGGIPLIAYTIRAANKAVEAGILDRVIVSTDSENIRAVALDNGADAPFIRPESLSGDRAKSVGFVLHALDYLREYASEEYDAVMILQPTSPLRNIGDVEGSVRLYLEKEATSLISCYCEPSLLKSILYHCDGDIALPISSDHRAGRGRQENPKIYVRNGAIYLCDVEYLMRSGSLISEAPLMYEMPKDRSINIDSPSDLDLLLKTIGKQG